MYNNVIYVDNDDLNLVIKRAINVGGLGFDSRAGQIGQSRQRLATTATSVTVVPCS